MKKWTPLILLALLSACAVNPKPDYVPAACDPAMREWILQCIEKANPHSDEEPEDNTKQCERTAIHLFCGPSCFLGTGGTVLCDAPSKE